MGPRGYLDNFKMSESSYPDRPLDMSFYLLMRTKEKMAIEAELKVKPENKQMSKMVGDINKDIDNAFA